MVVDADAPVQVCHGRVSVQHTVIGSPAVVEGYIVVSVTSHGEHLPFIKLHGKGVFLWVRIVYDIRGTAGLGGEARLPAYGVVVQCQYADGIVHCLGGVAGHTDDFAHQVGDVGAIVSPLDVVDTVAWLQRLQFQPEIFVFGRKPHGGHRTVFVCEQVAVLLVCGFYGIVVAFQVLVIQAQERRGLVGRAEVPAVVAGGVPHAHDVALLVDVYSKIVGPETGCPACRAACQQGHGGHCEHMLHEVHGFLMFGFHCCCVFVVILVSGGCPCLFRTAGAGRLPEICREVIKNMGQRQAFTRETNADIPKKPV